jgi:Mn2+/Fe2+ NRAMP family transporter
LSASKAVRKKPSPPKSFLQKLGPGLITGASDDDPSGIATYSQTEAQFRYRMLWVMLFSYPLMTAMKEISARIGSVTGIGIAGNMRKHHSRILLYPVVFLLCLASISNLGADLGAMGAGTQLLFGGPAPRLERSDFIQVMPATMLYQRLYTNACGPLPAPRDGGASA